MHVQHHPKFWRDPWIKGKSEQHHGGYVDFEWFWRWYMFLKSKVPVLRLFQETSSRQLAVMKFLPPSAKMHSGIANTWSLASALATRIALQWIPRQCQWFFFAHFRPPKAPNAWFRFRAPVRAKNLVDEDTHCCFGQQGCNDLKCACHGHRGENLLPLSHCFWFPSLGRKPVVAMLVRSLVFIPQQSIWYNVRPPRYLNWFITPTTMVYGIYNYSYWGL